LHLAHLPKALITAAEVYFPMELELLVSSGFRPISTSPIKKLSSGYPARGNDAGQSMALIPCLVSIDAHIEEVFKLRQKLVPLTDTCALSTNMENLEV